MTKFVCGLTLALVAQGVVAGRAQAQPDIDAPPKAENPPNWQPRDFARRGGPGGPMGGPGGRMQMLTPEQMREQQSAMRASLIRRQLMGYGFTDEALLASILAYDKSEQEARAKFAEKYQKFAILLRNQTTTDAQLAGQLNDLRAAMDDEKMRADKALAELRTKIGLDLKPRLDAVLMTLGVTGNERSLATQGNSISLGGFGGMMNLMGPMGFTTMPGGQIEIR